MKNTITLPTQTSTVAPTGQKAGAEASAAPTAVTKTAEPAKATKRDPLMEQMPPRIRKVLEKKQAEKSTGNAAELPEQRPMAAAASETAKPNEDKPKTGDEAKNDDTPDAGIIDFAEPATEEKPKGEDEAPTLPTEVELADVKVAKQKIEEAHKDNAKLRKDRREAREAKEKLEKEVAALNEQLKEASAARQGQPTNYLSQFTKAEQVESAKADALEALRQLQEDPEREVILLPGNRPWKMTTGDGKSLHADAAETALEILDSYDGRLKQLNGRSEAEKLVKEKLPVMAKAVPDFEKRYKANLGADWTTKGPELSLHAAIGELVTSGQYVLRPRQAKAETKPTPKPQVDEATEELPSSTPGVRTVVNGEADVKALKAKYLKTKDPKDMSAWIKAGGRKHQAA